MLKLQDVSVKYGSFTAIHNVSLEVNPGQIVVLLGANGAGKSTIFKTISGLNKASSGSIEFESESLNKRSPDKIVQSGIVQCAEGRKLFPSMTVEENLKMGAYVHRKHKKGIKESLKHVYELFPILQEKQDDMAGSLSGGQQRNACDWKSTHG